ncbi:MAG: tRNA (adenosine(37)-N6)-threonylcarbamoyltransferase complex dimerization subunit type 1 TsaB [Candidatus Coproplasma sp.]
MSNFLAVDTSSRHLTVIAVKGDKIIKIFEPDCALNHSVRLMDAVDAAFNEADLIPAQCDFFAAVTGPGSFTGIRIGVSAVKGFALATGKKTLGVTSFDLIAYNVNCREKFLTIIDAAHGYLYCCGYNADRSVFMPPCYLSREDAQGYGLPFYGFESLDLPNYTRLDAGDCLYGAVKALEGDVSDDISALYVRKSQAEEGRK